MIPTTLFRQAARGAISAALAAVLTCAWTLSGADEASAAPADARAQGDFMEFLEYLGSWNGQEDQWEQFLSDSGDSSLPEALMVDADPPADAASVNLP